MVGAPDVPRGDVAIVLSNPAPIPPTALISFFLLACIDSEVAALASVAGAAEGGGAGGGAGAEGDDDFFERPATLNPSPAALKYVAAVQPDIAILFPGDGHYIFA